MSKLQTKPMVWVKTIDYGKSGDDAWVECENVFGNFGVGKMFDGYWAHLIPVEGDHVGIADDLETLDEAKQAAQDHLASIIQEFLV
ncbi:MAG TPA: hypothetical protein VIN17_07695 [Paracoccaceae bacterium]